MSTLTPIGARLEIELETEKRRMLNEWFFKWHYIGDFDGGVDIDSFDGRRIHFGGIKFAGTARNVYWDTIQRYTKQKVGELFDRIEADLQKYPIDIRGKALNEARSIVGRFCAVIRREAVKKDRTLRGNGFEFPAEQDLGNWAGARSEDIESRVETLRHIYVDLPATQGEDAVAMRHLMNDRVTLVRQDGTVVKEDIKALVAKNKIMIDDANLPIQMGDHLLRKLPSNLVEDYVVVDPLFFAGQGGIEPFWNIDVRRSNTPAAPPQTVIQNITNHVTGVNSRVTIGTDNSSNSTTAISGQQVISLLEQLRPTLSSLPEPHRSDLLVPIQLLEDEVRSGSPEQSTLREGLLSLRTIAEGAAGNLVASGIVAMVTRLLAGS